MLHIEAKLLSRDIVRLWVLVCLSVLTVSATAQGVNISLPQANIQNTTSYTTTQTSGSYSAGLSVGATIKLAGSNPILFQVTTSAPFLVNNLGVQLISIGGVNLLSGSTAITLSTANQTIFSSTLSVGSGAIMLSYTIPTSGYAWVAGNYTTNLTYTLAGVGVGASVVNPGLLTITIPAFIVAPASIPTITLNVNNLNYYTSQTISSTSSMAYSTTVPYNISINGNNINFSYSNPLGLTTPTNLSLTNVLAKINTGGAINLSGSAQSMTGTPIAVSGGNNQSQTLVISIPPASLTSQFSQTGTYTVPLTLTTSDARSSPTVANQSTSSTLTINVADMQAFTVNDALTTINLSTIANYQGVTQAQPNHMTVSSTSPWSIAVKTSGSNLTNGANVIPVNYVSVGNSTGQSILTTTPLSASSQNITTGQAPAISKTVGVNYSISAVNASNLISLPSGTYSTTVTYTLSAL